MMKRSIQEFTQRLFNYINVDQYVESVFVRKEEIEITLVASRESRHFLSEVISIHNSQKDVIPVHKIRKVGNVWLIKESLPKVSLDVTLDELKYLKQYMPGREEDIDWLINNFDSICTLE